MEGVYRGIESSLLALSLVLTLTVAVLAGRIAGSPPPGIETTLPTITITGDDARE